MKFSTITTLILLFGCLPVVAAEPSREAKDIAAIRAAVDSYVAAFNRGDAKAVAGHWSETGEWISPDGERVAGRPAIEKAMTSFFAQNKGAKIEVLDPKVRLVTPEVAIEDGGARVIGPNELPNETTYVAIHVKRNGQWKLDSVRETDVPNPSAAAAPLEELAWMVGNWIDQSKDATVETTVAWTKNKSFLTCTFKLSVPGMDDLEGTQVIGWDAAAGTIRSWMFDSDGGFGEGVWAQQDNRWTVKFNQTLPDGRKASSTNVYTCVDPNHYTWKSIGRQVDGQFAPNVDEVTVVRKETVPPAAEKK